MVSLLETDRVTYARSLLQPSTSAGTSQLKPLVIMSNRDLASDFDNLLAWEIEEVRQVGSIALHHSE
jgi:hypothetical protein